MTDQLKTPFIEYLRDVTHVDEKITYMEIRFTGRDGAIHTELYERHLLRSPAKLCDRLLDDGAQHVSLAAVKAMLAAQPTAHGKITSQGGWHDQAFIHPTKTFAADGSVLQLDPRLHAAEAFRAKGSLVEWQRGMRKAIKYSDYLLLASCLAPAASLLSMIREHEGFGFHLHGSGTTDDAGATNSTQGKSTAASVAVSIIECPKALPTFQATDRGFEEHVANRNNMAVVFDDEGVGSVTSKGHQMSIQNLAYKIAHGVGAKRSKQAKALPNLQWCVIGLTTGETPLDIGKLPRREGEMVRLIALPVPPGSQGGIFNRRKKFSKEIETAGGCAAIARGVEETITNNYGVVMTAFLEAVTSDKAKFAASARKNVDEFVRKVSGEGDPWDKRFAKRFGVVLAAARLMAQHHIGPWTEKRAQAALERLHVIARQAIRIDATPTDNPSKIVINAFRGKKLPRVKKGHAVPSDAIGFVKKLGGEQCLCFEKKNLFSLIAGDMQQALQGWRQDGILVSSGKKFTKQLMLNSNQRKRHVVLRLQKLKRLASSS